jgi:hypothetical protein
MVDGSQPIEHFEPFELLELTQTMKITIHIIFTVLLIFWVINFSSAQCAMCTKTASQLGEKPALGLNNGILYLMLAPFAIMGYIGYRWWKNRSADDEINESI